MKLNIIDIFDSTPSLSSSLKLYCFYSQEGKNKIFFKNLELQNKSNSNSKTNKNSFLSFKQMWLQSS